MLRVTASKSFLYELSNIFVVHFTIVFNLHCFSPRILSSFPFILQVSDIYSGNKAWCEKHCIPRFGPSIDKLHRCCIGSSLLAPGEICFLTSQVMIIAVLICSIHLISQYHSFQSRIMILITFVMLFLLHEIIQAFRSKLVISVHVILASSLIFQVLQISIVSKIELRSAFYFTTLSVFVCAQHGGWFQIWA